jgi:hypothetical protein
MSTWTKESAQTELTSLIREIDRLTDQRRFSAERTRWIFRTLEEVFGRESHYYQSFVPTAFMSTDEVNIASIKGPLDLQAAMEVENQAARDLHEQWEMTRGILQAALEHIERTDDINTIYRGKDTAPEASAILKIINLAEHKLRKAIREKPSGEIEVQDAFETLLIGSDIPYKREKEAIEYSSKKYFPDFTFPQLELALDLKFCGTDSTEKRLIKEINDYIVTFQTKYANCVLIVYDLGFIRDVDLFTGSFEQHPNVFVRVVKH